jgi:ribonuclease VapC
VIVVDSSAVIAILERELGWETFKTVFETSTELAISALTVLEVTMVVCGRHGEGAADDISELLTSADVRVEPFTHQDYELAAAAFLTFGKGRHPARLNMGDCVSYALAMRLNAELLFKGNDFAQTDLRAAVSTT